MVFGLGRKTVMPSPEEALPGRAAPLTVHNEHALLGHPIQPPFPEQMREVIVGLGCFWGAERCFWTLPGVYTTAVGYSGGYTPNPTYEEVCSGLTGHNEVVRVVYDPAKVSFETILATFWTAHNPTQGMRQGNDTGTQYRSGIYVDNDASLALAQASRDRYQAALTAAGLGEITTEIVRAGPFYYAENYHQQYLHKNPGGYCGLGGTGVNYPE
ncbi:peptide-methionine (S)-S-oxide reductase MsrA [Marinimicrobium alkaliphilum]|uniref:peptide-methionine (S)-S-oxide reductase MsrA n=1 Tax=Marinimicrobium alkaliphilum TaxID=2202654 RepID=UPI0018E0831E|nr:peptide-methionine (S)-S-oxide reductase MsrA [Marinimicrobium alkaliphilum]